MAKNHTFKQHKISNAQRRWLEDVVRQGDDYNLRATKVRLLEQLPPDFDPFEDARICRRAG
ncbi:MAG: hypothetical protein V3T86_07380, partial [Planctomycetota bacterium]